MNRTAVWQGIGAAVPSRVVTNAELSTMLDTTDEWIRTRTGIRTRRWAEPGTTTGDLATLAGRRALDSAGVDSVDLVILATSTPNHSMPGTAPEVAAALNLGNVGAYDISAACAGFLYATSSAAGAIAAGVAETVLVIGADLWSTWLDPEDRSTSIIFGDGAGAAVFRAGERGEPGAVLGFDLGSDGGHRELALVPGGASRARAESASGGRYMALQGKEIFTHAVRRMSESSAGLLGRVGWGADDLDWCVGHQANLRILHMVADVLGVPHQRLLVNIDRVGNTSAASIPLALHDAVASGQLTPGDRVLMTTFGGGLSWGSAAVTWPRLPGFHPAA